MRLAVLVSGEGRNLAALIEACASNKIAGQIVGVFSNRADARALERAASTGIACRVVPHLDYPDRAGFDSALSEALDELHPDFVLLAGFMRVLTGDFVRRYRGRLLNIHPSLLPRHPGLHTHRRALEAGDLEHGATVHFVTEELDGGPAIIQGRVRVEAQDTAQSLGERVMQKVEMKIYPQTAAWLARGELRLHEGRVLRRDQALQSPLQLEHLEEDFR
ncbi:MAG: phosphoribosylglycinamide formyltransferase [Panacagrimonas sp.]